MARRLDEITTTVEKEILSGDFAVGEVINEVVLAERFGVSRTPVREALLKLSSTGLIKLVPGRGAVVVGISLQRVFESYEVLSELQGMAAMLATKRMTAFGLAQLLAIHTEMQACVKADDREEYELLDTRFHDLIAQSAANEVLVEHIEDCKRIVAAVRHASIESHPSLDAVYTEHERLISAMRAGDAEAARQAMRDHIKLRGGVASKLVATWQEQTKTTEAPA